MQRVGVVGDQRFVGPAVPDAAAHAQEIVDGDPVGVRKVREPLRDRIGDRELALLDQLQDRRPDHRLGDAADAERILGRPRRAAREIGRALRRHVVAAPGDPDADRHARQVLRRHLLGDRCLDRRDRIGRQRPRLRHRRGREQNERGKEAGREAHGRAPEGCARRCGNRRSTQAPKKAD